MEYFEKVLAQKPDWILKAERRIAAYKSEKIRIIIAIDGHKCPVNELKPFVESAMASTHIVEITARWKNKPGQ